MKGVAVIKAPPPDLVLGELDDATGSAKMVWGCRGQNGDTHAKYGMIGRNGARFRYAIPDQLCYWWEEPSAVEKACAESALSRHGYAVVGHLRMAKCNPNMRKAHGWE